MKRLVSVVCLFFLASGLAYGKGYEVTKKAGEYTVVIRIDKDPPVTGKNEMDVEIRDAGGKNITDAAVEVVYGMPAMPGMPAMFYKARVNLKDQRYVSPLDFSMTGPWIISVKFKRAGQTKTAKIAIDIK